MKDMKRELNINIKDSIKSECWNFCRLAAVLSEGNKDWYSENFWEVNIYDGYIAFYYEIDSEKWAMPNYDKVLDVEKMTCNKNVVPQIIEAIDKGGYPVLYIQANAGIMIDHEILVYGYDDEKRIIKCLTYVGPTEYWASVDYTYEEVENSFRNEIETMNNDKNKLLHFLSEDYPACVLYKRARIQEKVDLYKIYRTIRRMLQSGYQGATGLKFYYKEDERWVNVYRGIEIYKLYYVKLFEILEHEELYLNTNFNVINSTFKIHESKEKMKEKILYLFNEGYIPEVKGIIEQIDMLCFYIRKGSWNLSKYRVKRNKQYLCNMRDYFQIAELLEKAILEQLVFILGEQIHKEFMGK